jgi:FkbM family methyltransferase
MLLLNNLIFKNKFKIFLKKSKIKKFSKIRENLFEYNFDNGKIFDHSFARINQYAALGYKKVNNLLLRYSANSKTFASHLMSLENKVIIDVGSNIGEFSKNFIHCKPVTFYAFEPSTECMLALKKNLFDVKIFNIALSDKKERRNFYYNSFWTRDNSFDKICSNEEINFKTKKIQTDRFDNIFSKKSFQNKTLIVKIDCEGHEFKALKGFGNLLDSVKYFLVDVGESGDDQKNFIQIKRLLKNFIILRKNKNNIVFKKKDKIN